MLVKAGSTDHRGQITMFGSRQQLTSEANLEWVALTTWSDGLVHPGGGGGGVEVIALSWHSE